VAPEYFRLCGLSTIGPVGVGLVGCFRVSTSWFICMPEVLGASSSSSSLSAHMEMSESESSFSRAGAVFSLADAWATWGLVRVSAGVDSSELDSEVDESEPSMVICRLAYPLCLSEISPEECKLWGNLQDARQDRKTTRKAPVV
jgi:hypothetical protein